jgi:zinc protease
MVDLPDLGAADFDKLRNEWLGRFRLLERDPDWAAELALRQRFGAIRDPSHGTVQEGSEIVEQAGLDDVRSFYRRYYRPERLVVTVVGDVSPEEMVAAGEKALSGWESGPAASERALPASQRTSRPSESETKQGALVVAGIASLPPAHQDYHPLLILTQILCGVPGGGRLGDRVLAGDAAIYDIRADVRGGARERLFSVRAAASASEVEKVLALMRAEFARLREGGVTPEEVTRAKRGLIHAWAIKMGNNEHLGEMLQDIEAQGLGIEYLERYPSLIEAVSTDSLLDCARTRFEFDETVVVVLKPAAGNGV